MKEYLLKELTGLVELTKGGLGKAVEVLQVEAPEIIRQILAWEFCLSIIRFLALITFLSLTIICLTKEFNKTKSIERYTFFDNPLPYALPSIILGIFSLVSLMTSDFTWLKILIAPKLFLIEYLTALIK